MSYPALVLLLERGPFLLHLVAYEPKHVARLIESNLIINLNPPCALADTSWINDGGDGKFLSLFSGLL
jgi:hypothetical protein